MKNQQVLVAIEINNIMIKIVKDFELHCYAVLEVSDGHVCARHETKDLTRACKIYDEYKNFLLTKCITY